VVVCPIKAILYEGEELSIIETNGSENVGPLTRRVWDAITDIQYGRVEHPWSVPFE
jgi:branched-chain amino acid aminotransferase